MFVPTTCVYRWFNGVSHKALPISAIVVNARRNPVAVLQQARKRHPAWSYLALPYLTLPFLTLPLTLPLPYLTLHSPPVAVLEQADFKSVAIARYVATPHTQCMHASLYQRPAIGTTPFAPLH